MAKSPNEKTQLLNFGGHAPKLRDTVTGATDGYVLTWDAAAKGWYPSDAGSGGGSAPADATYVVIQANAGLSGERVIGEGTGITITDGGANGTLEIKITTGGVTNVLLANSSITVTAGDGLSGGESVALGATTSLAVSVDGSTVELSGGSVQVKDLGVTGAKLAAGAVTPAKLGIQPRKDNYVGQAGGSSVFNLSTRILAASWLDGVVVARNGQLLTQVGDNPADSGEYTVIDNGTNTTITLGSNLAQGEQLSAMYWA